MISTFLLSLFTVLLVLRGVGQLVVVLRAPRWLPPMEQWQSGLLPYPLLLLGQIVVLTLMVWISIDFWRGAGPFIEPRRPGMGRAIVWFSYVYFGGMVLRYIIQAKERGLGVIFITHNPRHAYPVGDNFLILKRGRSLGYWQKDEITMGELTGLMAGGTELEELGYEPGVKSAPRNTLRKCYHLLMGRTKRKLGALLRRK